MRHGSLFSGIGGFDLAAKWMGWDNVFHVEREPFCQVVLKKHFPESMGFDDVKKFDGLRWHGAIDILTGGFPCQPYSVAGKRRGAEDDRALWPEMLRIISEIRPTWVIGENVAGFINMGFDDCASDLEGQGYEVQAFIIPACAVNAPHRRDRIWIVAHSQGERQWDGGIKRDIHKTNGRSVGSSGAKPTGTDSKSEDMAIISDTRCELQPGGIISKTDENETREGNADFNKRSDSTSPANTNTKGCEGRKQPRAFKQISWTSRPTPQCFKNQNWIETATEVCRNDDGIPGRSHRFKSLGNAIVPQIAFEIFKGIEAIEKR